LPWTLVPDLNADDVDEVCFNKEAFLGLFAETALDAGDIVSFIKKAVTFANERLWGTLSASIIVHPNSLKDQGIAAAVDQAIADLRYGSVIINHWGALAYYAMVLPWGGYPGSDMYNIQSGNGVVNNPLMFDGREKSVIYTPFRMVPDPFAATAKRSYHYFRRDTRYQHQPSFANLARLMWAAVRS
jgi:hypothetical protein